MMDDADSNPPISIPSIQHIFSGKCVLITGATGFLGKALLEKLVRSCPSISQILVLIRHNLKYTSAQRLHRLLESNVFDRVKAECPDALGKIRELDGDVSYEGMKLSKEDRQRILSEVNYVFHCAASVRFENDPRDTLAINLLGVKNILDICHNIAKLEAFVHVSTAYSFCDREVITEKVYSESISVEQLEATLKWMNAETLKDFSDSVSQSRPSLYHYSKAMAEIHIDENCSQLPVIIVRPSIVTAAVKEPFPGWIDNYNGPSGFIALSSKGILKTLLIRPDVSADWVPVDTVVNTLIVAAHHMVVTRQFPTLLKPLSKPSNVPVINCVRPPSNCMTWSEIVQICIPLLQKYPSLQVYRVPGGTVTSCPLLHGLFKCIYHYIPAAILDLGMLLVRKERRFVNDYRRIHKVLVHLQLFTRHQFSFESANMSQLTENISSVDANIFPIDHCALNWHQYLEDYVHGVRKFFLKENDSSLPQARKKAQRLRCLSFCSKWISISIILVLLMRKLDLISSVQLSLRRHLLKASCAFLGPPL